MDSAFEMVATIWMWSDEKEMFGLQKEILDAMDLKEHKQGPKTTKSG